MAALWNADLVSRLGPDGALATYRPGGRREHPCARVRATPAATPLPDVTERYVIGRNPSVHKLANAQQAFVIIGAPIEFEALLRSQGARKIEPDAVGLTVE